MYYVSENTVKILTTQADVTNAMEQVFIALSKGRARNFPIVRERLNYAEAVFGFKSGFVSDKPLLGVKAGGLWPGNREKGIANHQSTIVLFDPESGRPHALVRGTYLTGLRTAAASALPIRALARAEARTLGVIGAGGQAAFQIRGALSERKFERLLLFDQNREQSLKLAEALGDAGPAVEVVDAETAVRRSDVLITLTPSFAAIVQSGWVRPGTHLACMGADTKGKQEIDPALVARASLFGDEPVQCVSLGECQHAFAAGLIDDADIVTLGRVLSGAHPGRQAEDEITLFDSTGMGLQDLAAADLALRSAMEANAATVLDE